MEREKRTLKPYHGAIAFAGFLLILLVISPFVTELFNLGIYGSLFGEVMFLVLAIAMVAAFHGDFRRVFPIHKPKIVALFGTVLLWI